MTAKPVPEHISDERLAEMLALLDGKLPLRRTDNPDYAEIDGANWLQAMCIAPDALMLLNDVPSLLIELQHRREAEAGISYAQIIAIVDDCSERMKKAGESHRMLAKWISEGIHAASPSSPASGVRVKATDAATDEAISDVANITARAKAMNLGMAKYLVADVERVLSALGEHP